MSVMDDVAALRVMVETRIPINAIREIQQGLLELNMELMTILGPGFGPHEDLRGRSSNADVRLASALAACQEFESAIHDVADRIERAGG